MTRSERLLQLLQVLRRHRRPVSGQALADELGVSIRTLYRDIASLQAQGAAIAGEAGVGCVVGIGYLASTTVNTAINPNIPRPLRYGLVSGGYFALSGVVVCVILVAMR
jgi:biotin operon repressor